jgi:RNA polymerase sigma factor (sigma-70 family)
MPADSDTPAPDLLITGDLLKRAKAGDRGALGALQARYRPRLERWASARQPRDAPSLLDTSDLVRATLLRAVQATARIDGRDPGVAQAHLRQTVLDRIRDRAGSSRRRPESGDMPEDRPHPSSSPLESALGSDLVRRYEAALARLEEEERQLVHLRIELDFGYEEIAAVTGRPSADATRGAILRALRKLAEYMDPETPRHGA